MRSFRTRVSKLDVMLAPKASALPLGYTGIMASGSRQVAGQHYPAQAATFGHLYILFSGTASKQVQPSKPVGPCQHLFCRQ